MPAITLTPGQTTLINDLDTALDDAFEDGVLDNTSASLLDPFEQYEKVNTRLRSVLKDSFRSVIAAYIVAQAGETTSFVVDGTTLTFTNGILTGHS